VVGTIVNIVVVLLGGALGSLLGNRLPARMQETIIRGLGLVTLVLGLQMALGTRNILIVMFSILLGGIWGEAWRLDDHLNALGERIEAWFKARQAARWNVATPRERPHLAEDDDGGRPISKAFVTASLIFCIGPLATLGAIQDGLLGDASLLMIKSALD